MQSSRDRREDVRRTRHLSDEVAADPSHQFPLKQEMIDHRTEQRAGEQATRERLNAPQTTMRADLCRVEVENRKRTMVVKYE